MDTPCAYYSASISQFLKDAKSGVCLTSLTESIPNTERDGRSSEIESWKHNITQMASLLAAPELADAYIAFELFAPLSEKRIDCALFGKDATGKMHMTIIELKQWSNNRVRWAQDRCNYELEESFANRLTTIIAGNRETLIHPCEQCKSYLDRFNTSLKAIIDGYMDADAFAYCYNFHNTDGNILADPRYNAVRTLVPLYYFDDYNRLFEIIKNQFSGGDGAECFALLGEGFAEPQRFMDKAGDLLNEDGFLKEFPCNTDQARAERGIISHVRSILGQSGEKQVFIINGGPGTGKTIVGMRLLCQFIRLNKFKKCHEEGFSFHPLYMVRSPAVRKFLESVLPKEGFCEKYITSGILSKNFFRNNDKAYRIILYDECHRLGEEDNPSAVMTSILDNYDIIVFLMDERQCVAGNHRSPIQLIKESIESREDTKLHKEYKLVTQMRCDSSDNYIEWVESILYGDKPFTNKNVNYNFRICESAKEVNDIINAKAADGMSARICAGYCWPWHSTLKDAGNSLFHDDIVIGEFHMPWNTYKYGRKQILPPKGYVSKDEWAFRKEGIKQVGCIYTTQGLEFQYVGVIVGPDLYVENGILKTRPSAHNGHYRTDKEGYPVDWDSLFNQSADGLKDTFIRNIYRVLLTRGMKGCYVYFCDPNVRKYVEDRMPVFSKSL